MMNGMIISKRLNNFIQTLYKIFLYLFYFLRKIFIYTLYFLSYFFTNLSANGVWSIIISSITFILSMKRFLSNSSPLKVDRNSTKTFFINGKRDFCHFYFLFIVFHFSKICQKYSNTIDYTKNDWIHCQTSRDSSYYH